MVLTPSTMLELGSEAPDFELEDVVSTKNVSKSDFEEMEGLLVMFISRHCPYVQHIVDELARIGADYEKEPIGMVAISSNEIVDHPDDAPEKLAEMARQKDFRFPVCFDESQEVAKAFRAACTPDFFLFGRNGKLVYRGQLDGSRPGNDEPINGQDLRAALDALLSDNPIPEDQKPSVGCNIKWKPGNEPDYFK